MIASRGTKLKSYQIIVELSFASQQLHMCVMANWKEKLIVPGKFKEGITRHMDIEAEPWEIRQYSLGREDSGQDVVQKFKAPQN